jgi:Zn-dependent peptidase ImmA (M78 family)
MVLSLLGRPVVFIELNEFSFEHRAKEAKVFSDDLQGWFDPSSFKIYIRKSLSQEQKKRVYIHELMHAVLCVTGISSVLKKRHEEAVCTATEILADFILI